MQILKASSANQHTVQLQYVGHVYGTPASDLKVGSHIMWNTGAYSTILSIQKETKSFITFELNDGERRLKKDRIVGRPFDELPEQLKLRGDYPKTFKNWSDFDTFFEIFPEQIPLVEQACYTLAYSAIKPFFHDLPDRLVVQNYLEQYKNKITTLK